MAESFFLRGILYTILLKNRWTQPTQHDLLIFTEIIYII